MLFFKRIISQFFKIDLPSPPHSILAHNIVIDNVKHTVLFKNMPPDLSLAEIGATKSNDGWMDKNHHIIQTIAVDVEDLKVGQFIVWRKSLTKYIIHQIIDIGHDKKGWLCHTQGTNNVFRDSYKIRKEQVIALVLFPVW